MERDEICLISFGQGRNLCNPVQSRQVCWCYPGFKYIILDPETVLTGSEYWSAGIPCRCSLCTGSARDTLYIYWSPWSATISWQKKRVDSSIIPLYYRYVIGIRQTAVTLIIQAIERSTNNRWYMLTGGCFVYQRFRRCCVVHDLCNSGVLRACWCISFK